MHCHLYITCNSTIEGFHGSSSGFIWIARRSGDRRVSTTVGANMSADSMVLVIIYGPWRMVENGGYHMEHQRGDACYRIDYGSVIRMF